MSGKASNKSSRIKGLSKGNKTKALKERKIFALRPDPEFEQMLSDAKDKSGLKNESEVIRAALKKYNEV